MDPILKLLQGNAKLSATEIAGLLSMDADEVARRIKLWESEGIILGYQAIVDAEKTGHDGVTALIEVRIRPERGGGFDHLAERISRFDQVTDCYLMSGGYDLAVIVQGDTLREVARFVAEKLSTLEGVLSSATRFQLKIYKQNGLLAKQDPQGEMLSVTP
ncbi:MAG: Lrp/AsnC family transcriptional regulator [Verrucomicrobiales bacterium]